MNNSTWNSVQLLFMDERMQQSVIETMYVCFESYDVRYFWMSLGFHFWMSLRFQNRCRRKRSWIVFRSTFPDFFWLDVNFYAEFLTESFFTRLRFDFMFIAFASVDHKYVRQKDHDFKHIEKSASLRFFVGRLYGFRPFFIKTTDYPRRFHVLSWIGVIRTFIQWRRRWSTCYYSWCNIIFPIRGNDALANIKKRWVCLSAVAYTKAG